MTYKLRLYNQMDFYFPSEQIPSFSSFSEVKSFINQLLVFQNLSSFCAYKFRMMKQRYIYCLCSQCTARLVFKKQGQRFMLMKAKLSHQHKKIAARSQYIIDTIKDYPSCFNTETIKKMTMGRFQISSATFYRYLRKCRSMGEDLQSVLTSLQTQGIFGVKINSSCPDSEFPSILLLTCELMIKKYHENGKNIKFDLTYNLVREKSIDNKQYSVGAFVTQNNNLSIEPVALVILQQETKQSFVRTFTQFIYLMKESPRIIITDEQKTIQLALDQLKERGIFTGQHFIDIFHVLRNAKKGLYNKPSINYLVALSRSTNLIEYAQRKQNCLQNIIDRDQNLLDIFQEKMERCCIAKLPSVFIGLSCTTNSIEKLNDMIKSRISYSQKYIFVVSELSKLLFQIAKRKSKFDYQKAKVEQFIIFSQVQELRYRLCKPVFRRLMRQLSFSSTCIINCTDDPSIFQIQEHQFQQHQSFTVQFNNIEGSWICTCELTQKIGIPCCHIIKVIILKRKSLIEAINPWWLYKEEKISKKRIMRPRKTRRHFG